MSHAGVRLAHAPFAMQELSERTVACPYCGERIQLLVDPSGGTQDYIEDCPVCCRPIAVAVAADDDGIGVDARSEDDAWS